MTWYQKMINLLDNTQKQPSEFRAKYWVEINDKSHGTYNTNSQIKFKFPMLKSSLCDYSNVCTLVKKTITIVGIGADVAAKQADERDKGVIFKSCAQFTDCISKINNTEIYNSKDVDVAMPM